MDVIGRFSELLGGAPESVPLDEACLLISALERPALPIARYQFELDRLAETCPAPTLDAMLPHLFGRGRFSGNRRDYYDPRNSLLDQVLERQLGIPITLAIVAMEVGRRLGVPLSGVGMPGHFLLRDKVDPTVFADPFHGPRTLDAGDCRRLHRALMGDAAEWDDDYLQPISRKLIVVRVLTNLKTVYQRQGDTGRLRGIMRLRAEIPGLAEEEAPEFKRLMAPLN